MVGFSLDDDQRQIQDMLRKFAAEELRKIAHECDESASFPEEMLSKGWEMGLTLNAIPEKYGGYEMGRSVVTGTIVAEELAYGDFPLAVAILAPSLFAIPILEMGTEEQKEKYLSQVCTEKYKPATLAVMEPRIDFDLSALQTTAKLDGNNYILNGTKCYVPMAEKAELLLVMASSKNGGGADGVDAFIVEKGNAGMKVEKREKLMGMRALSTSTVTFNECAVPKENRLGGDKGSNCMQLMNLSRVSLAAMAVGVAKSSLDYAVEYAKERHAFGEPIASRQAIAFMLAEMAMEVDATRLLTWKAAWKADRGEDFSREAYLAKTYAAEQVLKITDNGVQILGGHGFIREHPVERWLRNGRGFATFEGMVMV